MYFVSAMTQATSWPWKRTLSVASTACVSPDSVGIQASLCCASSSPVTTAITPGIAMAALVSMPANARMRVRAAHDHHVQHPGSTTSST